MTQTQQLNPLINWDHSDKDPMSIDDLAYNVANMAQQDCAISVDGPMVWVSLRDPASGVISYYPLIPECPGSKAMRLVGKAPPGISSWYLEDATRVALEAQVAKLD